MNKFIVGLMAMALFAPAAVFATAESCAGAGDACDASLKQNKVSVLQAQILQLTQLLTQLIAQKNTTTLQSVTWGGVTMNFPKDWSLSVIRPETDSDYVAQIVDAQGKTVASISKFYAGGDQMYTLVKTEKFTTSGGISVTKATLQCGGDYAEFCKISLGSIVYDFSIANASLRVSVPVSAKSHFTSLEGAANALDQWVKTITFATAAKNACFVPTFDLYMGRDDSQTNGEVSRLQLWLKGEGVFPDAQGTGYYGEKTAAAVMKWQKAHGMDFVTTKSGVGKQTRAKMQETCKGATPNSIEQSSTSYGLKVRFENVGGVQVAVAEFSGKFDVGDPQISWPKAYIDFGNNGSIESKKLVCPGANCLFEARYLYPKAGTYTVTLHTIKDYKKVVLATTQIVVAQGGCPVTDGAPYIAAISPSSGTKGTEADIWGCNLAGFEGDLYASFQTDGKSWILGDTRSTRSSASLIHVTVKEPCSAGQAYYPPGDESGILKTCPYTPMMPGTYSVSVNPWNKLSNVVSFTLTQ